MGKQQTAGQIKGEWHSRGITSNSKRFLLLFWGACQKVADSKIPSLP